MQSLANTGIKHKVGTQTQMSAKKLILFLSCRSFALFVQHNIYASGINIINNYFYKKKL